VTLVLVLWLVAILGVMATGHVRTARAETQLAKLHVDSARARAFAEAGVQRAILDLLAPIADRQWSADGAARSFVFDDHVVSVSVRDARGLVDLNTASTGLLKALLKVGVEDAGFRVQLADAIVDWRDVDGFRHLNGAEDEDYRLAGLPWTVRDGAFTSLEELRYVMGMSEPIYAAIAPFVTVYSGRAGVDFDYAPQELIVALLGDDQDFTEHGSSAPVSRVTSNNSVFHVRARAAIDHRVSVSLEAVIRLAPDRQSPYTVLHWREVTGHADVDSGVRT
jgi:general secretion pathway protein K